MTLRTAIPDWRSIFGYNLFFLTSFFAIAGAPIYLMARSWGASELFIGALAAVMPATQIAQVFVAPYLEHVSFKRFMLIGLLLRNSFYIVVAALPFLLYAGKVQIAMALGLLMVFMVLVDFSHGISQTPWMTWISQLVPERWRGRYFSIEQLMSNIGQIVFTLGSGVIIGAHPNNLRYGLYLASGLLAGWISLLFLRHIRSVPPLVCLEKKQKVNPLDLSWMAALLKIVPYRRMLLVILGNQIMVTMGSFAILFNTEELGIRQDLLITLGTAGPIGSALAVYAWGSLADRFGSRPIMALAYRFVVLHCLLALILALAMPKSMTLILIITTLGTFSFSIGIIGYAITNYRYLLGSAPKERLIYASVLYGLTAQVSTAIGPPLWGKFLMLTKGVQYQFGVLHIHRYSMLYLAMFIVSLATLYCISRLENRESDATPSAVLRYALIHAPGEMRKIASAGWYALSPRRER